MKLTTNNPINHIHSVIPPSKRIQIILATPSSKTQNKTPFKFFSVLSSPTGKRATLKF